MSSFKRAPLSATTTALCFASLLTVIPVAGVAVEPMAGAELTTLGIDIAGAGFSPLAARLRLALALNPDWEIGLTGGSGITDDSETLVTAAVENFYSGYVRYSAPLDDNARLVLMLGYGSTTLDVSSPLAGFPGSQDYSGLVYGISLQERLARYPHWIGSLDFESLYDDAGLKIRALSYGFRYEF